MQRDKSHIPFNLCRTTQCQCHCHGQWGWVPKGKRRPKHDWVAHINIVNVDMVNDWGILCYTRHKLKWRWSSCGVATRAIHWTCHNLGRTCLSCMMEGLTHQHANCQILLHVIQDSFQTTQSRSLLSLCQAQCVQSMSPKSDLVTTSRSSGCIFQVCW